MINIFNTLSGKNELLIKPSSKRLKFFVCGPTVYDKTHIGHARTYIFFDVVKRYLAHLKYKVIYLQNITDVHDKITEKAKIENTKPIIVARKYEKDYKKTMKDLNVISVDKYARATDFIPQIVIQIKKLLSNSNAYIIKNDGIYFDLKTFSDYGKLSRRTAYQAEDAISRVDESVLKRNKGDFCLWKYFTGDLSEPNWKTEIGKGRPGWHIEDTAITEKIFGPQYDIHGGGVDLKFPHHEAEIAQQESASGKTPFVKIWMHTGALLVNGKKMSKSLGNFITVDEFLKKYSSQVLRLIVLSHHYRSPIDYTDELAIQHKTEWDGLSQFIHKLQQLDKISKNTKINKCSDEIRLLIDTTNDQFTKSIQDDFNTPEAIAAIHILISNLQSKLYSLSKYEYKILAEFIMDKLILLGFVIKNENIPIKMINLAKKRVLLRNNKQFIQADDLRNELNELGYNIEDTPNGALLSKK